MYSRSVYSCHLFLISSASVSYLSFLSFIEPIRSTISSFFIFFFFLIIYLLKNACNLFFKVYHSWTYGKLLKLKLQYFGYLMWRVDSLEKTLMLGGIGGQEEKETTEDEMAGWHHWLDGPESEWTPGVGDGQGSLACCDSWGLKELDTTERLIWSDSDIRNKWENSTVLLQMNRT